jgi:hypothetical protein
MALATKAKDAETRQRFRQLAKDILEIGTATVKRLQMSADNAAYSYARSIRQAADALSRPKPAPKSSPKSATRASSPKAAPPAEKKPKKPAKTPKK